MAITVIGGLITSTLLSLLVVPAVFTYIDDLEHWMKRMMRKARGNKDEPTAPPQIAIGK
jgi:predicted RND superfamily exporter protein